MNKTKNEKNISNLKKYRFKHKKNITLSPTNDLSNSILKTQNKDKLYPAKKSLQIQPNNLTFNNNLFSFSRPKLKRNKTTNYINYNIYKNEKEKITLSKEEKKKLNSIIKKFKNNKLATNGLFNKEKKIPLNSMNKSNFYFLINEEEKNNKNKQNIKNIKKSGSISLSSSMMNKFNNKTSSILDIACSNRSKFSKNLFSFRNQIINSYTDQDKNTDGMEFSKTNYKDALYILDETEENKLKKTLKSEEKFYNLKNRKINLYEIDLDKENYYSYNIQKNNSFKNLKNYQFVYGKNIDNKNNIKNSTLSSKTLNLKLKLNSSKKILNNLFDKTKTIITIDNNTNMNSDNKTNSKKCFSDNNKRKNRLYTNFKNFINNKHRPSKKKFISKIEEKMLKFMEKYWLFQNKKILEKSQRFANSMAQMNFFKYKPKEYVDYKNATLNINSQNLTRVIKLIRINKYLCDLEDDDLMVMDSKKLRELMKEAEMKYYSCNKKDFQLSYLKKNLRPQTISKFCRIKNSFFGLPC